MIYFITYLPVMIIGGEKGLKISRLKKKFDKHRAIITNLFKGKI